MQLLTTPAIPLTAASSVPAADAFAGSASWARHKLAILEATVLSRFNLIGLETTVLSRFNLIRNGGASFSRTLRWLEVTLYIPADCELMSHGF